jgi:5-methylcytosine-specific restriction endonuclease McrA
MAPHNLSLPQQQQHKQQQQKQKQKIPKALREQVWIHYLGTTFETKCTVSWCKNQINTFNYHVGHDQPESKGGTLAITNLRPICARCNLSMGSTYTIQEWNLIGCPKHRPWWQWFICGL